ncbi:MAG: sensor histidine kinase [Gammaproteobacteria bacterium]
MMSLERRLLVGIALSVLVVFAVLLGGGTLAVRELNEAYVYARLQDDAEALLAALRPQAGEPERSRSLWDEDLPVQALPAGGSARLRLPGPADQELLVHVAGFERAGRPVTVAVGEDITPLRVRIRHYQFVSGIAVLVALALLMFAQQRIVRSALHRLDALREDVRRVGSGERAALGEDVPREVRPLVSEFNRLLASLAKRLARSRHAVGNLAHALKTPLSLLTRELERDASTDRRLTLAQVARIRQLIERELRRARIAGSALPGKQFDAAADVPALVESLRRLHRERDLDIAVELPDDRELPIDREDALELLGNLLDNACKWARQRVRLRVTRSPGGLGVDVEDDGPGVPPGQLEELAGRGTRIDESTEGHGLGLAIVSDIVASYDGRLGFDRSPDLGGLRARLVLPDNPRA